MGQANSPVRIDIVSDVVCPWCIIGYRQLERAARESGIEVDIHWHPFELNPHMAAESENLREHVAAKYGTTPEQSIAARERLTALGAELGFVFQYSDDMRMFNTFLAHQLLHWADTQGRKHALKQALFEAFFTHRRNIGDIDVLAKIAAEQGLDHDQAERVLRTQTHAEEVRRQEQDWLSRGISGVPAMILEQKYLVTGAQGVANYRSILAEVAANRAA